jgi:hypothetical protein
VPGRVRLVFSHHGSPPTGAEFAALLDDIEAAYRAAFWTVRPDVVAGGQVQEWWDGLVRQAGPPRQNWVSGPREWSVALPPAPLSSEFELHAERLSRSSPFEFLGTVQGMGATVVGLGGLSATVALFVKNLEFLLDAPQRIKLRRIQRGTEIRRARIEREQAELDYLEHRRQSAQRRFELQEGEAVVDDDARP